jgi:hypothetical protein
LSLLGLGVIAVGAEQLRRAGVNIDFQEMDFGTVVRRKPLGGLI